MKRLCLATVVLAACTTTAPAPVHDLLIADYAADAIFHFDGATGALRMQLPLERPAGVRVGPDGELYAAGFGRSEVVRYELATGTAMGVFFQDTTILEEPVELAFVGDELLVLGNDTANVAVLDRGGQLVRTFGYPRMRDAHDFVMLDERRLLVGGDALQIWDVPTGALVAETTQAATGLALGDGVIYVADWERDRVVAFDADLGHLGVVIDGLHGPVSLERVDDLLYVLDRDGLHRFEAATGAARGTVVAAGAILRYPRGFTLVPQLP